MTNYYLLLLIFFQIPATFCCKIYKESTLAAASQFPNNEWLHSKHTRTAERDHIFSRGPLCLRIPSHAGILKTFVFGCFQSLLRFPFGLGMFNSTFLFLSHADGPLAKDPYSDSDCRVLICFFHSYCNFLELPVFAQPSGT